MTNETPIAYTALEKSVNDFDFDSALEKLRNSADKYDIRI